MKQKIDKFDTGIDVLKAKLDINYDESNSLLSIRNQIIDFKQLNHIFPKDKNNVLVIIEATGGYEAAIVK